MTERDIYDGIQAGKPEASEALAETLQNHLGRYFLRLGKETAEDLLQELQSGTLEAIQQNLVEHPEFLIAYARGFARILLADALEKRAALLRKVIPFPLHLATQPTEERDLIRDETDAEMAGIVHGLLEKLPELDREIVRRSLYEHRTPEQIQKELKISPERFRDRKSRALNKLRTEYKRIIRLSPGPDGGFVAQAA